MLFKHSFKTALIGLKTHKMRSVLTILGIVIGIAAIILVMSLGEGAQNLIISQIQGIGSKTIAIVPGRHPKGPSDIIQTFSDSLKERDLESLRKKSNVPDAESVMPIVFGGVSGAYQNETYWFTVFGATEAIIGFFDIAPEKGFFFDDSDVASRAEVAVIGVKVKKELFGDSEAIGQKIKIKNRNFRVIGVLPAKGQFSFFNLDEVAMVPYTTAQQYIFGIKYFNRLIVNAKSEEAIPRAIEDIKTTLRNNHNIIDPEKEDFFVETQGQAIEQVSVITDIFTAFLAAIAAVSLVVGGIGIMNIMLVSVTERTREIGLRKAIGATKKDILIQFLLEAVILTIIGGIIGIIFGTVLAYIVSLVLSYYVSLDWVFIFPFSAVALGMGVAALIGLVFGIYPARQASLKSPMEALRYE
ncbi:ABC transporter permease [Candidatus Wolfebacteria bacterium]|nr:ABC transporter permease [Candidatus Wolfebacteria bacterium]